MPKIRALTGLSGRLDSLDTRKKILILLKLVIPQICYKQHKIMARTQKNL
jgi:hypothetical protein